MSAADMQADAATPLPGVSPEERDRLFAEVYEELRVLARKMLAGDRARQHIAPTELVHGASLKIMGQRSVSARERTHFLAYSAHIMRQVLIDEVRRMRAGKRSAPQVTLITEIAENAAQDTGGVDVEMIHNALERLAAAAPELSRLVELRYFSGLTLEEIADLDGISVSTVKRSWRVARAWLQDALSP